MYAIVKEKTIYNKKYGWIITGEKKYTRSREECEKKLNSFPGCALVWIKK